MADTYRNHHYGPSYGAPGYRRDPYEYPGYNHNLVAGPIPIPSYHLGSRAHDLHSHRGHTAQLAWPTEIPTRLRVAICCEECKMRLDRSLRDLEGVHDVGISGWRNAMVTVTGTAPARKILERARLTADAAELWTDSHAVDEYSPPRVYRTRH